MPHIKEPNRRENVWHKRTPVRAEPQPNFNTAHDLRVTHCPERATAQSLSIPFCRHRNIDARRRTNVDTKTFVQTIADQDATLRSSRWSASAKTQQICHWLTRERLQTEELKCLHARAFDPSDHKFSTHWLSESPQQGSPSTWRPFSQEPITATLPTQYDMCILFKPRIQNPRT